MIVPHANEKETIEALDLSHENVIRSNTRNLINGNSVVFSKVKQSNLDDLYWLSQFCLNEVHKSVISLVEVTKQIKIGRYYSRLNDITIVYKASEDGSKLLDTEVASRIRRAKTALMALDLDCEADIELAKVLNSGVVATGKVVANVAHSDPWD